LNPQDTLARLGSDQFAILMISDPDPRQVATLAERVRRALRTPMKIGGKEIVLTASIGIVVDDGVQAAAQDFLREGEIAMLRAKRAGADRIEIFTASMRGEDENRLAARERSQEGAREAPARGAVPADHPACL
jgi:diguanylate cyclase (GGDEF)-like protein